MTAKKYLKLIRSEQKELRILKEKKDTIYYSLLPSSIRYDKDNIQVTPENVLSEKVIKMVDLTREIDEHIKYLEKHKADALRIIRKITDTNQRQVLILYYLTLDIRGNLMKWFDVAEIMGYSEDWIKHKHGDALKEFAIFYVDKDI